MIFLMKMRHLAWKRYCFKRYNLSALFFSAAIRKIEPIQKICCAAAGFCTPANKNGADILTCVNIHLFIGTIYHVRINKKPYEGRIAVVFPKSYEFHTLG